MAATKEINYEVIETADLFNPRNPELGRQPGDHPNEATRLVAMDEAVAQLFGERIRAYFAANSIAVSYLVLPSGDENKVIENVLRVASRLNAIGTPRVGSAPIAIGGGTLQDMVGMAASLYRRGIPYVRVPTTLLGQIDGSVSAKTGVNHDGFRNRLGTFAPPPRTLIDRGLLATLPERQISSGLGEALKMALIKDARLFEILEAHGPRLVAERLQDPGHDGPGIPPGQEVMRRSITGMAEELRKNLWEDDLQRIVDYGHTFSPIVEMRALPELLHGEAVAMGCVFCAILAANRGLLTRAELDRIVATTVGLGLAPSHPLFCDAELLTEGFVDTVRHRGGQQHLTLLNGIGKTVFVNDLADTEIAAAAAEMRMLRQGHDTGASICSGSMA
ncbi:sedoheptulose 7-phosphate cyclase [Mycobacterium lacus]|uniref:2-epi-5-epi-valiolone synthase n=1 Tax=Mycobacterium lacus TaxID=169765 RepID=A0A1X1YC71_9MYCO|nr:sedoheptulose 7-phosphate cyclase [Mycobacterium lacus]MCV7124819.1 sedoheptulose 7-phosphate cyclase [Mycobacterium lacus]ORW08703.1 2-epi-5-epi-valiolone synthase [Mycobacterium lacus]BBX94925.1 3-dehydroquinate synthase [Mycobacterium lacus]